MEINQQVCSVDLSKRLHELGVMVDSLFIYAIWNTPVISFNAKWVPIYHLYDEELYIKMCNTYTSGELGLMLPPTIITIKTNLTNKPWYSFDFNKREAPLIHEPFESEADCRAKALIYCIENELVNVEDINP